MSVWDIKAVSDLSISLIEIRYTQRIKCASNYVTRKVKSNFIIFSKLRTFGIQVLIVVIAGATRVTFDITWHLKYFLFLKFLSNLGRTSNVVFSFVLGGKINTSYFFKTSNCSPTRFLLTSIFDELKKKCESEKYCKVKYKS